MDGGVDLKCGLRVSVPCRRWTSGRRALGRQQAQLEGKDGQAVSCRGSLDAFHPSDQLPPTAQTFQGNCPVVAPEVGFS